MEYKKSEHDEKKDNPQTVNSTPKQSPDQFWKITTVVLIVVLGVFLFRGADSPVANNAGNAIAPPSAAAPQIPAPRVPVNMEALMDDDPVMGDANAPVTIIEWSDYECPFCGRFYSQTLSQIKSQYIDSGKVKLVYRDFPLSFHPQAAPAAIAANCASEQKKYFEFHDKIFDNGGAAGKSSVDYKRWAEEINLDVGKWEVCLSDPAQAQEVQKDFRDGQQAGIQGTPGFLINGQLLSGAQPFSVFQQVIDAELAG